MVGEVHGEQVARAREPRVPVAARSSRGRAGHRAFSSAFRAPASSFTSDRRKHLGRLGLRAVALFLGCGFVLLGQRQVRLGLGLVALSKGEVLLGLSLAQPAQASRLALRPPRVLRSARAASPLASSDSALVALSPP